MTKRKVPSARKKAVRGSASSAQAATVGPVEAIKPFPIVGLGASAGGLEALETFFAHVPPDCGLGFVVVTHLHPGHVSLLPELLGKCTRMPVLAVVDGVVVKPNTVYMSKPESHLAIFQGALHLVAPDEAGLLRLPIDYFFRSLAEDQKERAVGIVLSGTGTDGTLGVKAIKGMAGMTMAQASDSAKYSGMPASAIATGLVDYVLAADRLPQQLIAYSQGSYVTSAEQELAGGELSEPLQKILLLLRARAGHDFSVYKASTIRRRIERRINVHQLKGPRPYLRLLHESPHELDMLFKELLIGVTNFFRDPEAFSVLAKTIIPRLLAGRLDHAPVRVWVPGCSTGEEAYSLTMLLQEAMDKLKKRVPVQIFATDLDVTAIEAARSGLYPDGIARDVSPQRLARFFIKEEGGYRIKKELRELVVFAPQDALKDPPFTKLDLVSCRNMLIYLKPVAQSRLLSLFHYALKPGGVLFLGSSEGVSGLSDHFSVLDPKWKLFARKDTVATHTPAAEFTPRFLKSDASAAGAADAALPPPRQHLAALLEKTLLVRYAPASAIVNDRGDILFLHGRTGDYLEPAPGQPRWNILEMAREGLHLELPVALRRAVSQKGEVVREGVRVKTNGDSASVRLTVAKLTEPESIRGLLLVTFQPEPVVLPPAGRPPRNLLSRATGRLSVLERELRLTKENLRGVIEKLQTSNEELKSTNEELQSTNEELQSANEELETSKEEMQSLNEELQTVNAELQAKLDALAEAGDDMQNLLNSTTIATIFLDQDLRIKRFTAEATKLVKLLPSDIGRPIGDLTSSLDYHQLQADAAEVLRQLGLQEKEVRTSEGEWRQVRILPYRTAENVIDGVVVTFVDIDRLKKAEQAAQQARGYAESIVATVREPLVVLDESLCVVSANRAFYRFFKTSAKKVEQRRIYELGEGRWDIPALRRLLEEIPTRNTAFEDFKVEQNFPGLGHRVLLLNARRLAGTPGRILLAFGEVSGPHATAKRPAAKRRGSGT